MVRPKAFDFNQRQRVLSIDPSGTGTSGFFFTDGKEHKFSECKEKDWRKHYAFITSLVKVYQPNLLLFETTNFINNRSKDSLNLIRLLGALECLGIKQVESVNVLKVKEMSKALLRGQVNIPNLTYQIGRGKGWMFNQQRISIHCLEAFLVYWLWKAN